jgi:predicted membrane-bound spermidine synthase
MEISLWKKWLSYISPIQLEATTSEYNPELTVMLDRGRLQLLSGNAIYSWDDLYHNFTKAFDELKPEQYNYQDVLLLGLGLGSVPYILEKKHGLHYYYTAVEWDEAVSELADRYTFSRLKSAAEIITTDAAIFVEICEATYDMVIIDLFEDNKTPDVFETTEFLEDCIRLVNPGGMILVNRLSRTHADAVHSQRYFDEVFKQSLPDADYIDTDGNLILYWKAPDQRQKLN